MGLVRVSRSFDLGNTIRENLSDSKPYNKGLEFLHVYILQAIRWNYSPSYERKIMNTSLSYLAKVTCKNYPVTVVTSSAKFVAGLTASAWANKVTPKQGGIIILSLIAMNPAVTMWIDNMLYGGDYGFARDLKSNK